MFSWINRLFDFLFWPFRSAHPLWAVTAFSVLTGIPMIVVYRYTSNQPAIRRAKDRIGAHILEVRLFQDQLAVVGRAYLRILRATGVYLGHSLKPLLVMLVPLVILLAQLELRLGNSAAVPGTNFLLKAKFSPGTPLDGVELHLPAGLNLTAPALRVTEENEVDWRVQATAAGNYSVEVAVAGQSFSKQVAAASQFSQLSPLRTRGWLDYILYPGEDRLPSAGPLETIRVSYSPRELPVLGWKMHWLIPFFVLSLIAGFAVKGIFRVEF